MKERIKELDELLKHRMLADGDDKLDRETLRLMELRSQLALAEQIETLNRRLHEVTEMMRNKF